MSQLALNTAAAAASSAQAQIVAEQQAATDEAAATAARLEGTLATEKAFRGETVQVGSQVRALTKVCPRAPCPDTTTAAVEDGPANVWLCWHCPLVSLAHCSHDLLPVGGVGRCSRRLAQSWLSPRRRRQRRGARRRTSRRVCAQ